MKVRINKYDTACMVVGHYSLDGEYHEEIFEKVELKKRTRVLLETFIFLTTLLCMWFPEWK